MKVGFFTTNNKAKASIVERFNRTLKTKMWKYFTEMNTKCYIDVLGKLVYSYNHTWHRSIRMEPSSVSEGNQTQVWLTLYGQSLKESKSIFKVGDTVRISREKLNFEKGYTQNWTREIFTIHQILSRNPIVYRVKDLSGEIIQGTFYPQELQKVSDSGFYPVEKVIRTRKRNGNGELLVRRVPPGCYETVPDILKGMHLELHQNKIEFIYHSVTKKVKIKLASFPIIYAYCDLVEPQIVGHTQAPLLKIIKVEGKDGEVVNAHYTRPHYVPVIRQQFQTIEMILRLHSGDLVPFERGRVIAVLHFRLRQII
ncbi:uncharacterized transposon-derived protein F54H12.3 [Trichonephila clavipes]|nr:uncharacterized transposon-derived protein F54H12.3 [Trichonephila clavipes]